MYLLVFSFYVYYKWFKMLDIIIIIMLWVIGVELAVICDRLDFYFPKFEKKC